MKIQKKEMIGILLVIVLTFCLPIVYSALVEEVSGGSSTYFTQGGTPQCVREGENVFWEYPDRLGGTIREDAINDCYKVEGITEYGIDLPSCCPENYVCVDEDGDETYACIFIDDVEQCEHYDTLEKCGGYNLLDVEDYFYDSGIPALVGQTSISQNLEGVCDINNNNKYYEYTSETGRCLWLVGCGCEWDESGNEGDGECNPSYNHVECQNPDPEIYECVVDMADEITNLCDQEDGFYEISWTTTLYELDELGVRGPAIPEDLIPVHYGFCIADSATFDCPPSSEIPFFTMFNLILSLGAIVVVYFVWKRE